MAGLHYHRIAVKCSSAAILEMAVLDSGNAIGRRQATPTPYSRARRCRHDKGSSRRTERPSDLKNNCGPNATLADGMERPGKFGQAVTQSRGVRRRPRRAGHTPRMVAVLKHSLGIARLLVARGASLNITCDRGLRAGTTAFRMALYGGKPDVARLVLESGADPNGGTKQAMRDIQQD
ncbi:hypothetical protein BJY00DRAFT_319004 [Aspergillus carlsbadensis]|nr:hypothetical protein BJY00DRAFT_319004 [Aspergillus carlsbadensis]